MKTKIEIKSVFGSVLFSFEKENNTIKDTLQEAVKQGANLSSANLRGAYLRGADDLSGANLRGAYLSGADLSSANLSSANLRGAYLRGADLSGAYLSGANLSSANLSSADLSGAYLSSAYLSSANLSGANLSSADLSGAYLRGAYLRGANLRGAYLSSADLSGAYLRGAKSIPYIPLNCPSDGAFIGWKKFGNYLIELEIPADARRLSSTSYKCRCDKAFVKSITLINDTSCQIEAVVNKSYEECHYKVGELVIPDSFDENRWNECSHGIHFFINKQDAINY